jgi:hypothetical protein
MRSEIRMEQSKPKFFVANELAMVASVSKNRRYDPKKREDREIALHVSTHLIPKTRYWAESVTASGYVAACSTNWQVMGYLLHYTWARLFKKGDEQKGVFFTVGADFGSQALVYKLDCQRDRMKRVSLTKEQVNRFDRTLRGSGAEWQEIGSKDLSTWNWERLFAATKSFMQKYDSLYEDAIAEVWGEKRNVYEKRISRLCWNTNSWVKPSGRLGKSRAQTHEREFGFGHEEWLFDMDKVIGNDHYGFLVPIRKFPKKYIGKRFDLLLYTIDSVSHLKYWIGHLKGVEAINDDEAEKVLKIYKARGWLERMRNDLISVGLGGEKIFSDARRRALDVVNVKFSPSALTGLFETPLQVADNDESISIPRYVLLKRPSMLALADDKKGNTGYSFGSGNAQDPELARTAKKKSMPRQVELELKHNEVSTAFFKFLKSKYGKNVRRECKAFGNNKIDIVLRTDDGDVFYEVKTYNFLETSFRQAIGQLLEYCFYPDVQNAVKLFIVSDLEPSEDIRSYVRRLNTVLTIPLGYIQFDPKSNTLMREI